MSSKVLMRYGGKWVALPPTQAISYEDFDATKVTKVKTLEKDCQGVGCVRSRNVYEFPDGRIAPFLIFTLQQNVESVRDVSVHDFCLDKVSIQSNTLVYEFPDGVKAPYRIIRPKFEKFPSWTVIQRPCKSF